MKYLTGSDLSLYLDDVFQNKLPLLGGTNSFKIYQTTLAERRERLGNLYRPKSGRPLAEELSDVDRLHDSTGRAVYYLCLGLEQLVTLSPEKRDLLAKVRQTFVPALGALQAAYEDQAGAAAKKREALSRLAAELQAFPVAPDLTLHTLVEAHVSAGESLGGLLARRSDATVEELSSRDAEASVIRMETIGLLGRFRQALADEIAADSALPRDLEAQVFGYLEQLEGAREGRAPKKAEPAPAQA
ncbi:MAG TPA: hypothetical protein VM285_01025 [Polyangia bacterium]|nr:hypothetical protein [Polyangia bacterium]